MTTPDGVLAGDRPPPACCANRPTARIGTAPIAIVVARCRDVCQMAEVLILAERRLHRKRPVGILSFQDYPLCPRREWPAVMSLTSSSFLGVTRRRYARS
ncbi:MAG: hypothetical protein RL077_4750 [Verrucomicrobiota bacterium]